ncbi:AraC family transcriptional regulator [Halosquirtibacter xylanolyticus]|uniref:AraC family transcriptional regulator n=1 Tax=Halosquirtibacter xylanolyticus TaxID=3374599 RepID=UPI0037496A1A|nr:AraC family transcriptional regulator [Prolixibacteraceae bacterium]
MEAFKKIPDIGDPSDIHQHFPSYDLHLLCCRYWWLRHWEFQELSFPYWRIYHNSRSGASIIYNGQEHQLSPDEIVMIAPNTSYATRMFHHPIPKVGYALEGNRIDLDNVRTSKKSLDTICHLFIHFNLGMPYDSVSPEVFFLKLTPHIKEKLDTIKDQVLLYNTHFSFHTNLAIRSMITDLLFELPQDKWLLISKDYRIIQVMNYLDQNISEDLTNPILASEARMSTNAFTRLFKEETGISPQQFVKKKRIDHACILLHHSEKTIDEIAILCGFADRYHFSRIFKQHTTQSPAKYRRQFGLQ